MIQLGENSEKCTQMCGLVGGNNSNWHYDTAVEALSHRGPDSMCVQTSEGLTLGFARLAVQDVSAAGDQPMSGPTHPSARLVFNGEIYGHERLRRQLTRAGQTFRSNSDTEVVLNAWRHWGPEFVDHIDGMFALAIHDARTQRILLYRDRAGIKPLYYFFDGHNFAFASELKALRALCGDASFQTDETALYDFFTYGYVPTPKSLFRNVSKLPPASCLVFDARRKKIESISRYWELPVGNPSSDTLEEAAARARELLRESVREQLVADVPVGCFLSGGIDSSIVTAEAASAKPDVETFSVGFDDPAHSETQYARQVAEAFDTRHSQSTFRRLPTARQMDVLHALYDEPFADTSAFPTSQVSELARRSVTVALSGDGGDELFGGYRWYHRYARIMRFGATRLAGPSDWLEDLHARQPAGSLRRKIAGAASMACADPIALYARMLGAPAKRERRRWAAELGLPRDYDDFWHFRPHWRPDLPIRTRLQYLDFHTYLPDDILTKVDRASMAHALEVRVPFLKRELVEFAFSLPEKIRFAGGQPKGLLKHAYRQILPADILRRSKKGFSIPPVHLAEHECGIRHTVLTGYTGIRNDADCLSIRLHDSVAEGEQHSGDAHVRSLRRRRA